MANKITITTEKVIKKKFLFCFILFFFFLGRKVCAQEEAKEGKVNNKIKNQGKKQI